MQSKNYDRSKTLFSIQENEIVNGVRGYKTAGTKSYLFTKIINLYDKKCLLWILSWCNNTGGAYVPAYMFIFIANLFLQSASLCAFCSDKGIKGFANWFILRLQYPMDHRGRQKRPECMFYLFGSHLIRWEQFGNVRSFVQVFSNCRYSLIIWTRLSVAMGYDRLRILVTIRTYKI